MIAISPPDFYDQKQVENYFIQLIVFSNTPYEAFKEFCKNESNTEIQQLARDIINSEYLQIKRKYNWMTTSLGKELI